MRGILCGGLLLLLLGVGVVHVRGGAEEGGVLLGWIQSQRRAPEVVVAAAPEQPEATGLVAASHAEKPTRPAVGPSAGPAVLAAGELSVLESDAPVPMVRYIDSEGSIRMVRGLERVPPEQRAGAVMLGRGNVNVVSIPAPTALAFRDWQPDARPNRAKVVLFSAPWCGACKRAKRHLAEQGIAYRERDIDADRGAKQEVQRILGRVAIPLLDVNGRYISGFRPEVYDRALGS